MARVSRIRSTGGFNCVRIHPQSAPFWMLWSFLLPLTHVPRSLLTSPTSIKATIKLTLHFSNETRSIQMLKRLLGSWRDLWWSATSTTKILTTNLAVMRALAKTLTIDLGRLASSNHNWLQDTDQSPPTTREHILGLGPASAEGEEKVNTREIQLSHPTESLP